MIRLPVFVSAPWQLGPMIREELHDRLASVGIEPVSSWVQAADGQAENLDALTTDHARAACDQNDRDVHRASAVLLLTRPGLGSASFGEVRYALALRKPVVWVGPRFNVDAKGRPGVVPVEDVDQAIVVLSAMRSRYAYGTRGFRLLKVGS
jgi:hypothetical protein